MEMNPRRATSPQHHRAFTLVEMIVSMAVLALIMILVSQLFNSATTITSMGNNHMDADSQARAVFDRMSIDFAQIVKRPDVDYYLKERSTASVNAGNDQLAFYSQVPGYYSSGTAAGVVCPVSLVGYRASPARNQLERYGCGLFWNGMTTTASGTNMAIVFSGSSTSSGPSNTIVKGWPAATGTATDPNYEPIGPEVFRFEYFYMLKGQTGLVNKVMTTGTAQLSDTPWDSRIDGHTSVNGLADVAAIGVVIAVINPKSRAIVTDSKLATLVTAFSDFPQTDAQGNFPQPSVSANGVSYDLTQPGGIEAEWQAVLDSGTSGLPRLAASSIRIYKRYFYLTSNAIPN